MGRPEMGCSFGNQEIVFLAQEKYAEEVEVCLSQNRRELADLCSPNMT